MWKALNHSILIDEMKVMRSFSFQVVMVFKDSISFLGQQEKNGKKSFLFIIQPYKFVLDFFGNMWKLFLETLTTQIERL